ncbi:MULTISPECIES: hypothetical protein [unclassified Variovorax]|uniref:hypothetical protein n=1 Tax=unclassified Variovorax TaxID=663243 RepID=UPI00076D93EF|nr:MULTISPECIES: hypothetical protein [unclassified Variovorax]KWT97535.1 hypothetical protein APY03_1465 [Variovorax sp. WDL1]PNG51633.1 hypothetical protein CHC06_05214 [Variovorax sp. B2]PNG54341.1 hypothetical protein CHC07_04170 [Variovorax sp. B4]VTV11836.1 hypothetical protein WDL1CHR_02689 [Variovorax sp. WDL1]
MKPLVEIQRVGSHAFTYRISAFLAGAGPAGDSGTFDSLAFCLYDAGASLGSFFSSVELNVDGLFLGSYPVDALRRHSRRVAQRIEQHFQLA